MTDPKLSVGIFREDRHEHGYTTTHVYVMHGALEDVRARLAGTWDNRAGYGTQEAAERLEARFRGYLREGIYTLFDNGVHNPWLHASFLLVSDGAKRNHPDLYQADQTYYCEPRYDIGSYLGAIRRSMPLLDKCKGRRTRAGKWIPAVSTPDELVARFPGAYMLAKTGMDPFGMVRDYYVAGLDMAEQRKAR